MGDESANVLTLEHDLASFMMAIVLVRLPETNLEADKYYSGAEIAQAVNTLDDVKNNDYFVNPVLFGHSIVLFHMYIKNRILWETLEDRDSTHNIPGFSDLLSRSSYRVKLPSSSLHVAENNESHQQMNIAIQKARRLMSVYYKTGFKFSHLELNLSDFMSSFAEDLVGHNLPMFFELLEYKAKLTEHKLKIERMQHVFHDESHKVGISTMQRQGPTTGENSAVNVTSSDSSSSSSSSCSRSSSSSSSSSQLPPLNSSSSSSTEATTSVTSSSNLPSFAEISDDIAIDRSVDLLRKEFETLRGNLFLVYPTLQDLVLARNSDPKTCRDRILRDVRLMPTWFKLIMPELFSRRDEIAIQADINDFMMSKISAGKEIAPDEVKNKRSSTKRNRGKSSDKTRTKIETEAEAEAQTQYKERLAAKINKQQIFADILLSLVVSAKWSHQTHTEWLLDISDIALSSGMTASGIAMFNLFNITYSKSELLKAKTAGLEGYYRMKMNDLEKKCREEIAIEVAGTATAVTMMKTFIPMSIVDNYSQQNFAQEQTEGKKFTDSTDTLSSIVLFLVASPLSKWNECRTRSCCTRFTLDDIGVVNDAVIERKFELGSVVNDAAGQKIFDRIDYHVSDYTIIANQPGKSSLHKQMLVQHAMHDALFRDAPAIIRVFDPEFNLQDLVFSIVLPEFMKNKAAFPPPWHLQKHALESLQSLSPYLQLIYAPLANFLGFKPSIFTTLAAKLAGTVPESTLEEFPLISSSSSSSSSNNNSSSSSSSVSSSSGGIGGDASGGGGSVLPQSNAAALIGGGGGGGGVESTTGDDGEEDDSDSSGYSSKDEEENDELEQRKARGQDVAVEDTIIDAEFNLSARTGKIYQSQSQREMFTTLRGTAAMMKLRRANRDFEVKLRIAKKNKPKKTKGAAPSAWSLPTQSSSQVNYNKNLKAVMATTITNHQRLLYMSHLLYAAYVHLNAALGAVEDVKKFWDRTALTRMLKRLFDILELCIKPLDALKCDGDAQPMLESLPELMALFSVGGKPLIFKATSFLLAQQFYMRDYRPDLYQAYLANCTGAHELNIELLHSLISRETNGRPHGLETIRIASINVGRRREMMSAIKANMSANSIQEESEENDDTFAPAVAPQARERHQSTAKALSTRFRPDGSQHEYVKQVADNFLKPLIDGYAVFIATEEMNEQFGSYDPLGVDENAIINGRFEKVKEFRNKVAKKEAKGATKVQQIPTKKLDFLRYFLSEQIVAKTLKKVIDYVCMHKKEYPFLPQTFIKRTGNKDHFVDFFYDFLLHTVKGTGDDYDTELPDVTEANLKEAVDVFKTICSLIPDVTFKDVTFKTGQVKKVKEPKLKYSDILRDLVPPHNICVQLLTTLEWPENTVIGERFWEAEGWGAADGEDCDEKKDEGQGAGEDETRQMIGGGGKRSKKGGKK